MIAANQESFLDPVLLAAFGPVKPLFAVNTHIANARWVKPLLRLLEACPMDPAKSIAALQSLATDASFALKSSIIELCDICRKCQPQTYKVVQ